MNIVVPHILRLPVGVITIDKYLLSVVVDLESQISLSFTLDNRKRLVFRPSKQI